MRRRIIKKFFIIISLILTALTLHVIPSKAESTKNPAYIHARPSINGQLHVEGIHLVDESGNPVMLRGISTHGLTWYPEFVDNDIFAQISTEWDCNMIRLPLYSEIYCKENGAGLDVLKKGIEYAIANDMYVLVDWHILDDNDPNINIDKAIEFFEMISLEYANVPNLIYEICNEPNGDTDWNDVYEYSEKVIPVIRKNSLNAVIVVGTPDYDRNLAPCIRKPLPFENVMYVLHFYTATHHEGLQAVLLEALDKGLPVFVSECGISEASGDGGVDYKSAVEWFDILNEYGISYAVWSLSNKSETSAILKPAYDTNRLITDEDLTPTGKWIKALIQGQNPSDIPVEVPVVDKSSAAYVFVHLFNHNIHDVSLSWRKAALLVIPLIIACGLIVFGLGLITKKKYKTYKSLIESNRLMNTDGKQRLFAVLRSVVLLLSIFFSVMYLYWRIRYSIPTKEGAIAVICSVILLIVELFGFIESLVLYANLISIKDYPLPTIDISEYPEVDIFIATYNEPTELLYKTVNACNHLSYPDKSKVHIWICDDNRRAEMRALAKEMKVGYFDRPDNEGAKAGNLNHALGLTSAPYVVTLDADMIVKSDFLLKTIPYFVNAEKDNVHLGLLQTPQCFYEPDVFQYALYSEKNAPNEQDFFYRTIEVAKTSTNSVIYGGSNTVIARKALEDCGGFYTGSITEDFATGLLIESEGYVSLGLAEPLASGKTPDTFKEHIKQRIRWGRGVISTARKLKIFRRKGLSIFQKLSYWSSVVYWYSSVKNLIYILSPLMFAVLGIPVFKCTLVDLLLFWFPMFVMQDLCLRVYSKNAVSLKWSGIYETSVMPFLLVPIVKEFFGYTTSKFAVTDKSGRQAKKTNDTKGMIPFLVLIGLSVIGLIRIVLRIDGIESMSLLILSFWIIRNLYFLIMSLFLIDGRDGSFDGVNVVDAEVAVIKDEAGKVYEGVTTFMTEHGLKIYLDEPGEISIGDRVEITIYHNDQESKVSCVITGMTELRNSVAVIYSFEILNFNDERGKYLQVLYDRIPTLPQSLTRDYGIVSHLVRNIAYRVLR